MHLQHAAQHRGPARTAVRRTVRAWILLTALGAVAAAVGCSPAPAGEPDRRAASTTTTMPLPAAQPIDGALRAEVQGLGSADPAETDVTLAAPPDHVVLVGDSVLVQIADDLARRLSATLHVDAADCRRIDVAVTGPCGGVPAGAPVSSGLAAMESVVGDLASAGTTADAAVVVLANNSSLQAGDLDAAMQVLAEVPRVWWVTARIEGFGRQDLNNALLADLAERDPRAGLIDWYGHSRGQDWLGDHVHPDPEGELALAALVTRQLRCDCSP